MPSSSPAFSKSPPQRDDPKPSAPAAPILQLWDYFMDLLPSCTWNPPQPVPWPRRMRPPCSTPQWSLCWTLWSTAWEIRRYGLPSRKLWGEKHFESKSYDFSGWKWNRNIGEKPSKIHTTREWRTTASQHVWMFSIFPFSLSHLLCLSCLLAGFEFRFYSFRDSLVLFLVLVSAYPWPSDKHVSILTGT